MPLARTPALLAVLVPVTLALPGTGSAAAAPSGCARAGEKVISSGPETQVVAARGQEGVYDRVFACLRGRSKRLRLDRPSDGEAVVGRPVITGKMLAAAISSEDADLTESALVIVDVAARRRTYAIGLQYGADLLRDAELKRNGAAALIQRRDNGTYEVLICRLDACGGPQGLQPVVADTGAGIEPRSLTRHGSVISWIHDGKRRTAKL